MVDRFAVIVKIISTVPHATTNLAAKMNALMLFTLVLIERRLGFFAVVMAGAVFMVT